MEIQELLCGGWITQRYLVRPCPQNVVQWLFHILSYHLDSHTVQASYNCLWSLLNAEPTKVRMKQFGYYKYIGIYVYICICAHVYICIG